ncbi:hypothetical protein B0T16DRAFT_408616 [Cercophora newfieldiana]|uniref:Uncharacterized protein n=1 Tax=Cercophora newfieldiana TaxID=92897 RepID=A0AA39YB40_9PEZI|nr:hypothetical protein B0T16DRAFT_408616 [Cercophora newfieldiana]
METGRPRPRLERCLGPLVHAEYRRVLRSTLGDCNVRRRAHQSPVQRWRLPECSGLHAATPPRRRHTQPPQPFAVHRLSRHHLPSRDPPAALPPQISCSWRCSRQPRTRARPAGPSGSIAQDKLTESDR